MSDATTKKMLAAYTQQGTIKRFLTSLFSDVVFHNSEKVEIDIEREGEDVAIVVLDGKGYNVNDASIFTNKEFLPPAFKESISFEASSLLKRDAGENPFADLDFQARATARVLKGAKKLDPKIRRSIELQASQILTTGKLNLLDSTGAVNYSLDFVPKTTHFFNAGTAWNAVGGDPIGDITTLCNLILADSLLEADQMIMGSKSFEVMMGIDAVQKRFDMARANFGQIAAMQVDGNGGQYRGTMEIGNRKLDVWTYDGNYKHPQTGASTRFIPDDKVVIRASMGRMTAAFGAIPRFVAPEARVLPYVPARINQPGDAMDMSVNAWVEPNGETLTYGVGSRPLLIPVAIDSFGCIDTGL